ncbi:hypothetical protein C8Q80DRAFT_293504 [Daedaleopsis nitida]|nr:hypothetical protein C8Q80DRAFT_293504 [Daedaleopsis nitida]
MAQPGYQNHMVDNLDVTRDLDRLGRALPVDERAALSKLAPQEVPAWADSRVAEYERRIKDIEGHISTFRSLRNAQLPIHVLPSELLGRIFVEACSSRQDLRVAQVCRRWRVVVMGTPQVWANALEGRWMDCSHESERDFLQFALSHSGVLLLYELNIVFEVANAWPIIQPHASRLVSLVAHMDLENQVAALETALSSGRLHNLHSLQVITPMWPSPRLSVDARSLPRLRKLHIGGDIFTSTSTVDSLEDLGISGPIRAWEDLACALKPCTALKSLHLYYALPKEEMEEAGDFGLAAVALPKLRTFVLEDQAEQIRKLLQHLALPSSVTSTIHINMRSSADGRTLLDAIPPTTCGGSTSTHSSIDCV